MGMRQMLGSLLRRSPSEARPVQPQKHLTSLSEKKENVRGAFKVRRAELIRGRQVLIVDDVYDSGATLEEAWRAVIPEPSTAPLRG